ncbi:MAG: NAD(P)-dependent glycerol-1-phosphate dehydrogenase, partial [Candidatus Kariarchaeaceae archaeon]
LADHNFRVRDKRPIIELPRLIDVQLNAYDYLIDSFDRLKLKGNAVLLADKNTMGIAGNRVADILEKQVEIQKLEVTGGTIAEAERALETYGEVGADLAIAVGGGTVIDVAKYSSFIYEIPFVSVPTVASHDGIASARASLTGSGKKHSLSAHSPLAVIGDVETISKAPKRFTISGCADIISNMTAVLDWELANRITGERISQYAIALSRMTAQTMIASRDVIVKDPIEGVYTVLKGLITSSMGMCIAGSSRPASGAEHMISHVLDEIAQQPALHGEQCGLASVITMYLHGENWQEIRDTLEIIKAPVTTTQIGIEVDEFIKAITTAHSIRKDRFTILSSGISQTAAEKALDVTGIMS